MEFYERLKAFRILRGLTQEDLFQRTGQKIGRTIIARHEIDSTITPRPSTVAMYARALAIDPLVLNHDGCSWCISDIFRPLSPFQRLSPEWYHKLVADLNTMLPNLLLDFGLTRVHFFNSGLGRIACATDSGNIILLVMPLQLSIDIYEVFASDTLEKVGHTEISDELFVSFTLDPIGTFEKYPDLPAGLRLTVPPSANVRDIYAPPPLKTRVAIALAGDHPDIKEKIREFLFSRGYSELIADLTVDRPDPWRDKLPAEIQTFLKDNNQEIDEHGRLVNRG